MHRSLLLLLMTLALAGCVSNPSRFLLAASTKAYAWDGLGQDPNRPVRLTTRAKPAVSASAHTHEIDDDEKLALVQKFSPEWRSIRDDIERRQDAKLAKAMIICRGCGSSAKVEDETGSIRGRLANSRSDAARRMLPSRERSGP